MKYIKKFVKNRPNITFVIGIFIISLFIGMIGLVQDYFLYKKGIFTIARYRRADYGGDGTNHYFEIFFNNKKYESILGNARGAQEGKYYYILINKTNIKGHSRITKIEVPQCIIDSIVYKLPPGGWKEIPKNVCK